MVPWDWICARGGSSTPRRTSAICRSGVSNCLGWRAFLRLDPFWEQAEFAHVKFQIHMCALGFDWIRKKISDRTID